MANELKTCPFCGGKATIIENYLYGKVCGYVPFCRKCGCELKQYSSKQAAERAWNRRIYDDGMIVDNIPISLDLVDDEKTSVNRYRVYIGNIFTIIPADRCVSLGERLLFINAKGVEVAMFNMDTIRGYELIDDMAELLAKDDLDCCRESQVRTSDNGE